MIQRAQRQRSGKPTVAVLGYTNAGKTSLVVRTRRLGFSALVLPDDEVQPSFSR